MPGRVWGATVGFVRVFRRKDRRRRWHRAPIPRFFAGIGWVLALGLLALELTSVAAVLWNLIAQEVLLEDPMKYVKKGCDETGFACTVASSIFFTVVPLLVGSFVFVFWRLRRVQSPLLKQAKEQPRSWSRPRARSSAGWWDATMFATCCRTTFATATNGAPTSS
jgi:hypothetical protein